MVKFNQLKMGVILSYLTMGIGFIITIVYTPIMLKLLGQNEYGLYNLVASVVSYLGLLSFGFGSAYIKFYYAYKVEDKKEDIAKLNGMFMIIFTVLGLIAIISGLVLLQNTEVVFGDKLSLSELKTAKILLIISVINLAISFPASVFVSFITANEKFFFQRIFQLVKVIASPFITLPLLLLGYKSIAMVISAVLIEVMVDMVNIYYCYNKLGMRFNFKRFDGKLMRSLTTFSVFIFINMIVDQINWNIDKFLLGRFYGTASVAIYGIAAQLNIYYMMFSTSISGVFIPKINKIVAKSNNNKDLTDLFTAVGRIQFMMLSLIGSGLVIFGKAFINMWVGGEYYLSYYIVIILVISEFIPLIQNIGIEIQRAKNMHKFRSLVYVCIAIGNLIVSIPLAKAFGGVGSAIGTALAQIIGNCIIMNIYYHKKIGIDIKYFWRSMAGFIPALILPIFIGALMMIFVDLYSITNFIIYGICYVLMFSISMWKFSMNAYEKALISRPILQLIMRLK